jgi:oxysterol-binding protein-related protein 9/10/11
LQLVHRIVHRINDHEDPLERMLAVLRFTFSKDIRHLVRTFGSFLGICYRTERLLVAQRGKPCKPYNSVLGENFRMHWDVAPISYDPDDRTPIIANHVDPPPKSQLSHTDSGGVKASSKSGRVGAFGSLLSMKGWSSPTVDRPMSTIVESNVAAQLSNLSLVSSRTGESGSGSASVSASTTSPPTSMSTAAGTLRIAYLTEQISHHPPISAYVATCPARHITLSGIDQVSVRVLPSASLRVSSGTMNKGLFVTLQGGPGAGERYHITHPVAHVNGVLRGSFYATVQESTIITCTGGPGIGNGEMLRAVVEYKEEVRFFFPGLADPTK